MDRYDPRVIALELATEGAIEAVLRKHTALICWNDQNASPCHEIADNGTCCFLQSEALRFIVTCEHVWRGFRTYCDAHESPRLWLSLVANDEPFAPSFPFQVENPREIAVDDRLDLATLTFNGISTLEPWRFYPFRDRRRVSTGDRVFFIGFTGDGVRGALAYQGLSYTLASNRVSDVGYCQFHLHNKPGSQQILGRTGKAMPPERWPGISGSPVFRVKNLMRPVPELVGFVRHLSSPGLTQSVPVISVTSKGGYELSDGDVYIAHADFIYADGKLNRQQ